MEVRGRLHAAAALSPGREIPIRTEQEAGRDSNSEIFSNVLHTTFSCVCVCVCGTTAKIGTRPPVLRVINNTQLDTSGRTPLHERSACRCGCYLRSTQQTQETNIHVLSGIRTRNPSNRAAADLRLPPGSVNDTFIEPILIAVVIGQWSGRPRNRGSISGSGKTFLFSPERPDRLHRPTQPSVPLYRRSFPWCTGGVYVNITPICSASFKSEWSYTSTSSYAYMACVRTTSPSILVE